ncbi:hypothetical protein LXA43DRAFT_1081199 [Ganoderma leucocontextum]|nr:hypothetical protein LXA43DRAFT_1081199 [Ganoderma leucocontextum]
MLDITRYKYRCGYIIDLESCKRYFAVGHQLSYDHIKPCVNHGYGKGKKLSAAERRLYLDEDLQLQLSQDFPSSFRHLRRKAPPEVRLRLVLLHSWMREVQHENPKFGERLHSGLFLPTDSGTGAKFREAGPTDVDRQRLEMFVETMNALLKQDADHEPARFTPADFAFETIPERAVSGPLLDADEMKELLSAGREFMEFYGVSPREFLEIYFD